ncbi:hypothetical protein JHL17_22360 [Azospirillum sp. YIM B02556]|uniref:Transposase n=1 Tax=Azospirillum endophyticum TaxID=2800326 RepID=A0ABS1F9S0_9PROT|nr:hypothetical protein [Azospirillum endophyticum]MBK1840154.1 hypothetical protein [Azospirillum endophyticum]
MTPAFQSIEGRRPDGADVLREQLRWTTAERRWRRAPHGISADRLPPAFSPPGRTGLQRGAVLTRLTMACAAGAAAIKEQ